jgi:GPH family glycoside/pentoside/hexuronide:cation symporter
MNVATKAAPAPAKPTGAIAPRVRLRTTDLFFYAIAQIGSSLFFHVPLLILLPFMTNSLAIPAAVAGLVVFLPKIWVVFCDPLMGAWSDRVQHRAGRRRPFVLWGGVATGLSFAVLFNVSPSSSPLLAAVTVCALYLLGSTAYSAFSVPYLAMAPEIAHGPDEVTVITSWRMSFNFVGALLAGLAPLLVQRLGQGRLGYAHMGLLLGAVCVATVLVFYAGTRTPDHLGHQRTSTNFREWLSIFENSRFTLLLATYVVQLLAMGVVQSSFAYFVVYQVGARLGNLTQVAFCLVTGSLLAQPAWVRLSTRWGKRPTYIFATVAIALSEGSYLLVGNGDLWIMYAVSLAVGFSSAGFTLMAWSMLFDVVNDDGAGRGSQRSGAFTGIWSACEKISSAVGVLATGLLLQAVGFRGSTSGFIEQAPGALKAVRLIPGVIPASILLLSLLTLTRVKGRRPAALPPRSARPSDAEPPSPRETEQASARSDEGGSAPRHL